MKSGLEIAQEAALTPDRRRRRRRRHPARRARAVRAIPRQDRAVDPRTDSRDRPDGKLVITTAITPTKAGEGKTTTSVSLTQGLGRDRQGRACCACGNRRWARSWASRAAATAAGTRRSCPMEEFNLHFNGDFHAVTAAHNLLAAALDASIYHGNPLDIDPQIDHVAAHDGHERPRAAQHRGRSGRQGARGTRARTGS